MNISHITPIFIIILIVIIVGYRITQMLSGSAPRRTKMIRGVALVGGIIIVLILAGLQIFHVIP
jgi:hypothetical protein